MEEAATLFGDKFKEKTGNDWDVDDHEDRYIVNPGIGFFLEKRFHYGVLNAHAIRVSE